MFCIVFESETAKSRRVPLVWALPTSFPTLQAAQDWCTRHNHLRHPSGHSPAAFYVIREHGENGEPIKQLSARWNRGPLTWAEEIAGPIKPRHGKFRFQPDHYAEAWELDSFEVYCHQIMPDEETAITGTTPISTPYTSDQTPEAKKRREELRGMARRAALNLGLDPLDA
jgi:hypothetical protein